VSERDTSGVAGAEAGNDTVELDGRVGSLDGAVGTDVVLGVSQL
jgi:hypothetical protein